MPPSILVGLPPADRDRIFDWPSNRALSSLISKWPLSSKSPVEGLPFLHPHEFRCTAARFALRRLQRQHTSAQFFQTPTDVGITLISGD